jgi:hypothetical protein
MWLGVRAQNTWVEWTNILDIYLDPDDGRTLRKLRQHLVCVYHMDVEEVHNSSTQTVHDLYVLANQIGIKLGSYQAQGMLGYEFS